MNLLFRHCIPAALLLLAGAEPLAADAPYFPDRDWQAWSSDFFAALDRDVRVLRIPPRGSVAGERTAMAVARQIWSDEFGREVAETARPYRAFKGSNRWLVTGMGGIERPGDGPVLVLTRDTGAVVMLRGPRDQAASDDDAANPDTP
jgi:hypothetical protein